MSSRPSVTLSRRHRRSRFRAAALVVTLLASLLVVEAGPVAAQGFACASDAGSLSWTDAGESKYWVYKSVDGGGSYNWIGRTLGSTIFQDPAPAIGDRYQVHYAGIPRETCTIDAWPTAGGVFECAADADSGTVTWTDLSQSKYWVYKSVDDGQTYRWIGRTLGSSTFRDPDSSTGDLYQVHYAGIPRVGCSIAGPVGQSPYGDAAAAVPGIVEAENYDLGGQGVAYSDVETANRGGTYRNDGVDVWTTVRGAGFTVGSTRGGEWTEYTVAVSEPSTFDVALRIATGNPNAGGVSVSIDGRTVGSIAEVEGSDWWQFRSAPIGEVPLAAGTHTVRVEWTGNGQVNFDRIEFVRTGESESGNTTITAVAAGKCLAGDGAQPGAIITIQNCDGSDLQTWRLVSVGGDFFEWRNVGNGLCLSNDGSTAGSDVVQWPCENRTEQQWEADGEALVARHSNLCLDVFGGNRANGTKLISWGCRDAAGNQQFLWQGTSAPVGLGQWSPVVRTPLVPVAGSTLPNGNVLLWSAFANDNFAQETGYTQTAIFDPTTLTSINRQISDTGHEMFCPGIANLADGRILINGGSGAGDTSIYDPDTNNWREAADMNIGRGYQGTALLASGDAFTLGGSWSGGIGNKTAEVWTEGQGWRMLPGIPSAPMRTVDAQGEYREDNHLWLFAWENDTIFHAGPSKNMHWINATGQGSYTAAGERGSDGHAMNGNAVMFAPGEILTIGGALDYNASDGTGNAHVIDIRSGDSATTRAVASMRHPRTLHNSVVLPSGEVLVVGGQERADLFQDSTPTLIPELWDPETETFTDMAPMVVPRTYHSIALLLHDGRVLAGGGGLCGGCGTNHLDVELFSPPYLFEDDGSPATRPVIQQAPTSARYGQSMRVVTDGAIDEFVLVRVSSATHSVNNEQRRIPLSHTGANGTWNVSIPTSSGVVTPGAYMLFAMDASGTPSIATTVTVGA